uniref:Uncharacterized protein n=1 Tax=Arundo donax TaxID=35708 RepID=A0A0A8Z028_ARUDO
MLEVMADNFK